MKNFIKYLIIIITFPIILYSQSGNATLLYAEYSIDSDPGFGKGIRVAAFGLTEEAFDFNIDLSSISAGLHTLFMRTYDSNGKFSDTHYRMIYVEKILNTTPDFDKLYYAIDEEITTGTLHSIPISIDNKLEINYTIDLFSLSPGLHTLFIVSKDINGKLSHRESRIFYCEDFYNLSNLKIKAIEYYFDNDPGFGMGNPIPITADENIIKNYLVSLDGMTEGLHLIHFRALDTFGRWSGLSSRIVYLQQSPIQQNLEIKKMYYVINGVGYFGELKKVTSLAGVNPEEISFQIDCSELTVDSTYTISFFIEANNGMQSAIYEKQFKVKFGNQAFTIKYESGWNLLSLPVENPYMLYTNVFPNTIASVYGYEGEYKILQNIPYSVGFWARFAENDSVIIQGNRPEEFIEVKKGWNIIGGFAETTLVQGLVTEPANIITTQIFGFSSTVGYSSLSALLPSYGYWVRTNSDGKIKFTANPSAPLKKIEIPTDWNKIIVSDGINNSKTVYLSNKKEETEYYELPPLPPGNMFDVRFANNSSVESKNGLLKIQSPTNLITISSVGSAITFIDPTSGKEISLSKGEKYTFNLNELSLSISNLTIPVEYQLFQNYPNPFNPETIIKFGLPEMAKVRIEIYNILGERVAELINSELDAGYHQVKWNANHYASGIYIYSIRTNSFSDFKKMILIK
ncbi:MAG: T9SS type A sorting domain-containing protein [Melioribacteraceae bacterium]